MKLFLYSYSFFLLLFACHRKAATQLEARLEGPAATAAEGSPIPACIRQKIDSMKHQPVWNPPAQINEYEFKEQKVYLISAPCCDFFETVVDGNCNYICAPSGGFTGKGDRKCPEFSQEAKHVRLVWKDERAGR